MNLVLDGSIPFIGGQLHTLPPTHIVNVNTYAWAPAIFSARWVCSPLFILQGELECYPFHAALSPTVDTHFISTQLFMEALLQRAGDLRALRPWCLWPSNLREPARLKPGPDTRVKYISNQK